MALPSGEAITNSKTMILGFVTSFMLYGAPAASVATITNFIDTATVGSTSLVQSVVIGRCNANSNFVVDSISTPVYGVTGQLNSSLVAVSANGLLSVSNLSYMPCLLDGQDVLSFSSTTNSVRSGTTFLLNVCRTTNNYGVNDFVSFTNQSIDFSQTLYWNAYTNLTTRMGGDPVFLFKTNGYFGPPRMNPSFWLKDVTNILAVSVCPTNLFCGWELSAISPRHCITAKHVLDMSPRIWVTPSGTYYTNTPIAYMVHPQIVDFTVVLMANTNPCYYKLLEDYGSKIDLLSVSSLPINSIPSVREHWGSVSGNVTSFVSMGSKYPTSTSTNYPFYLYTIGVKIFGDYSLGDVWVRGDSSSPGICVLNNEAVFECAAYTPTYGPLVDTNTINGMMDYLSTNNGAPVYHCTPYDLSQFPDIN